MADALALIGSLDGVSLVLLFWYTTLFEVPRYLISGFVAGLAAISENPQQPRETDLTVSIILAGHNEAGALPACIAGLAEQTLDRDRVQIIVIDDGSTDGMANHRA